MSHDPRALLWDIQQAAALTAGFLNDMGSEHFEGNALVRSAVERQLMIVGEAMSQLHKAAPRLAKASELSGSDRLQKCAGARIRCGHQQPRLEHCDA
jgi:uncharacterized protein with HEPN domain